MYNLAGQEVATLVEQVLPAGVHGVRWDATGYPSGIYLYCLEAGPHALVRKMLLLR